MIPSHTAWRSLVMAAVALYGCVPTHLRPNAPGDIDVRSPPRQIHERTVERPRDPGEHRLALTFGGLAGAAFIFRERADDGGGGAVSLELSAHYQRAGHSHGDDSILLIPEYYPIPAFGLNVGYQAKPVSGDFDLDVVRPFYLELQYSYLLWVAAGWRADFERSRHGPQLTGGLGPLYARFVHQFDAETQFEVGVVLKGWHVWVWSR
jgi:hypothetical protein